MDSSQIQLKVLSARYYFSGPNQFLKNYLISRYCIMNHILVNTKGPMSNEQAIFGAENAEPSLESTTREKSGKNYSQY